MELGIWSELTEVIFSSVQIIVEETVICAASASIGRSGVLCRRVLALPHLPRLLPLLVLLLLPARATLRVVLVLASVLLLRRRLGLAVRRMILELVSARLFVGTTPKVPTSVCRRVTFTFRRRSRWCATVLEHLLGSGR